MESAFIRCLKPRSVRWAVAFGVVTILSVWPAALAGAQDGAPPPEPGFTVGNQTVDSSTWNFNGDLSVNVGPWGQVTVTNTNCAVPYRPGTAQAGAIIFTATLQTEQTPGGLQLAQGDLLPFTGSVATGHVSVLTPTGAAPTSRVDATLVGLDDFALNNDFSVCLSPADMTGVTADVVMDANSVLSQSYQPFQTVVTPTTPNSPPLVAIAGTKFPTADGYDQWVFFFLGTTYLGTDTAVSSPQLDLTGSPGPGQVDVTYVDYTDGAPLCCPDLPPVTITYTWDGAELVASGTPPGH